MNRVGLTKTSERLFWASLFIYCISFSGFYFSTQHTLHRIELEEKEGRFLEFKEALCKAGTACSDITYVNSMNIVNKQYQTVVEVTAKKQFNPQILQRNYTDFMADLPWYIRLKFSNDLVIRKINGQSFKTN